MTETTSTGHPIDVILNGERVLPEAPASINIKLAWNGGDVMLTLRDFEERDLLARLIAIMPAIEESGMTIAGRAAPKKASGTPSKGTPKKAEPEGIVDETVIEVTSIYINSGKKGNYCFVKGTPGYEKSGAICFDDAWQGTGYDLQGQEAGKFYDGADFGFVRAVLRIDGGKARVWKFLTSHEQIAF